MKKRLIALMFLVPTMLFAQSAFEGTWRVDLQSGQFGGKPTIQSLQNGVYRCDTCTPKIDVKADGQDHDLKGDPYSNTVNVREIDDHTIESVFKKDGKLVATDRDTVSSDGNTLTSEWTFRTPNGQEGSGRAISKRVAPSPEGANKVSGSWRQEKLERASENILTVTFKARDGGLSMTDQLGGSYTAKFDGRDYPYKGNPGITSVSLKKIDANSIEETDKRAGKVITVARFTVSPDGKTMTIAGEDKLQGQTFKWTAEKQ